MAALISNTTGSYNTGIGSSALESNTTASNNTAVGFEAGKANTTGLNNVSVGFQALTAVTTGNDNTAIGKTSGSAITTGGKNSILGQYSGNQGGLDIRTASNFIVLSDGDGNPRMYFQATGEPTIPRLVTSTTASAANVFVSATTGELVRSTSALKYKQDIRNLEELDISALRPIRYKSKCERDDQTKDHLGLIADEAAGAGFEELVTRNANNEIEGFQYERLTVVLLKSLQSLKAEFDAYKLTHP